VRLLDNYRLINQFCALERKALSGGHDKVDTPRGSSHEDAANSAAGALWCAAKRGARMQISDQVIDWAQRFDRRNLLDPNHPVHLPMPRATRAAVPRTTAAAPFPVASAAAAPDEPAIALDNVIRTPEFVNGFVNVDLNELALRREFGED
jgi:hypothetical protein